MKKITVRDVYNLNSSWIPETYIDVRHRGDIVYSGNAHGVVLTFGDREVVYFKENVICIKQV